MKCLECGCVIRRDEHDLPSESVEIIFRLAAFAILVATAGMQYEDGEEPVVDIGTLLEMKRDIAELCSRPGPMGVDAHRDQIVELIEALGGAGQRRDHVRSHWRDCLAGGGE